MDKIQVFFIIITLSLSATFGLLYFILSLLQKKTVMLSIEIGFFCFLRGIIGGIVGSIIGVIIGSIAYRLIAGNFYLDLFSTNIYAILYFIIFFTICWIVGICIGSFLDKLI